MAGERIKLDVKAREEAGSAVSRRLRANGMIPGVLYGAGKQAHPFAVEERDLRRVLTGDHGLHAILDVVFEGQKTAHHAVLKDYQLDPVRPRLLHIDLHEVRLDQVIQSQVAVEPVGESPGVKEGGVLTLVAREINVEALPMEVPDRLELDISWRLVPVGVADLVHVPGVGIDDWAAGLVEAEGVLLLPGSQFGYGGNHFRLGLGRTDMPEALGRLEAFAERTLR